MPFGSERLRRRNPLEELTEEVQRGFPQDQGSFGQEEENEDNPVFQRYLEEIENAPRREDYEMGTGKKILAALAGGLTGFTSGAERGAKVIEDIREGPYRRDLAEHKAKLEPLEKGVGFEKAFGETLRKRTKDQGDLAHKYAEHRRKYEETKGKLAEMKAKASTADELAKIKQFEAENEKAFQEGKLEIERNVAGSRRISANADATRAGAYKESVDKYGTGAGSRPQHAPVSEQLTAEAVSRKEAFNDMVTEMPSIKGVKQNEDGSLKFPSGMVPQAQERYQEIFNELVARKTKERLGRTR